MAELQRYKPCYFSASDGKRIFYRDYGNSYSGLTPIICLSGLVRNSRDFDDFAARQAKMGRRVIAMDYRGRGRSDFDQNWKNYGPINLLGDVVTMLNVLNIHKGIFIGTSLGGLLSMGLAAVQPTRVAGVVMNDIGPGIAKGGVGRIKEYVSQDHPQPNWETACQHMKKLYPNLRLKDDRIWMNFTRASFKECDDGMLHISWDPNIAKTIAGDEDDDSGPDLWDLFKALKKKPVLAIRGELSDVLDDKTFNRMAKLKSDLIQLVIEGVGHCPNYDEPLCEQTMDEFFRLCDRQAH